MTCTCCHKVVEVDFCLPPAQFAALSQQTNFEIEGHKITFLVAARSAETGNEMSFEIVGKWGTCAGSVLLEKLSSMSH